MTITYYLFLLGSIFCMVKFVFKRSAQVAAIDTLCALAIVALINALTR